MLGLAVVFFLGLWLLITLWATRFGWRWGKKYSRQPWSKWLGAFLGFFVTMGWYITSEIYHFTKEQIWVTQFCTENPRLKIYITPEQLAEIIKTGDYSQYIAAQPVYKYIDEEHVEINGEAYIDVEHGNKKYTPYKVAKYGIGLRASKNTTARILYFVYLPYGLILFSYSEAYSMPRDPLRLKSWYHSIRGYKITHEERNAIFNILDMYRKNAGDVDK